MSTGYPTWKLSTKSSTAGTCTHVAGTNWSTTMADSFTLNYIDSGNNVQTIWFRNLGTLLRSAPVVYFTVTSNQGEQPNTCNYIVKSLVQNNNVYTIGVQYVSSSQTTIGSIGSDLSFYYYSSIV